MALSTMEQRINVLEKKATSEEIGKIFLKYQLPEEKLLEGKNMKQMRTDEQLRKMRRMEDRIEEIEEEIERIKEHL